VRRNHSVSYYIQISVDTSTSRFDATDKGGATTFGARLRTMVLSNGTPPKHSVEKEHYNSPECPFFQIQTWPQQSSSSGLMKSLGQSLETQFPPLRLAPAESKPSILPPAATYTRTMLSLVEDASSPPIVTMAAATAVSQKTPPPILPRNTPK
jgi:hypothetical protein